MSRIRTYTPEDQQRIVERYAHVGGYRYYAWLGANLARVVEGTKRETVQKGLDEYGDEAFHQTFEQRDFEIFGESIDAVFRTSIDAWAIDGRPDPSEL